ncbi:MAG: metallophosphoesterase, partial [Bacteroidaceae bacterium]|nr:metallophosphoesterase [Bacteroidaceae bacterium]
MKQECKAWMVLLLLAMPMQTIWAQMEFSFAKLSGVTTKQLTDGSTLVELPVGSKLADLASYGMSVTVEGKKVELTELSPKPASTKIEDLEKIEFRYKRKKYAFRFTVGAFFTAVVISDSHTAQTKDASIENEYRYSEAIATMGMDEGKKFGFDNLPGYVPTTSIVLFLGDMDKDSKREDTEFAAAMSPILAHGIPFVPMLGNHDFVPDYWTGDNPGYGLTVTGGEPANRAALSTIEAYLDSAQRVKDPIKNVERINDGSSHTQANPFTFVFHNVRFYCGQTYWFQKPYSINSVMKNEEPLARQSQFRMKNEDPLVRQSQKQVRNKSLSLEFGENGDVSSYSLNKKRASYYAPDGVIDALRRKVEEHREDASIWMQHYPFVAGYNCDRWWLDQTDVGRYIKTEDASIYGTDRNLGFFATDSARAVARTKKNALVDIIAMTKNPVHFSGHTHFYAEHNYLNEKSGAQVKDYTVAAYGEDRGDAYIVLCKEGVGCVEVKKVNFGILSKMKNEDYRMKNEERKTITGKEQKVEPRYPLGVEFGTDYETILEAVKSEFGEPDYADS